MEKSRTNPHAALNVEENVRAWPKNETCKARVNWSDHTSLIYEIIYYILFWNKWDDFGSSPVNILRQVQCSSKKIKKKTFWFILQASISSDLFSEICQINKNPDSIDCNGNSYSISFGMILFLTLEFGLVLERRSLLLEPLIAWASSLKDNVNSNFAITYHRDLEK